jgi:hypothetical protein
MDFYSDIKRMKCIAFWKCMELGIIILSEISQSHKIKYHIFSHFWRLGGNIQDEQENKEICPRCQIVDIPKLQQQLTSLRRKTGRPQKTSIGSHNQ